ncbi:amidase signature domain protein [Diplogelasinospora grovesii]|uniref:Amidase signature domain protein n=1 Tax=Diplogelasinospora grovesii TaxID=303347 RepID=A0AAN6S3U3_9PEZI|nr:amidase signature domain protein [Diplogelasinospora grovesii]
MTTSTATGRSALTVHPLDITFEVGDLRYLALDWAFPFRPGSREAREPCLVTVMEGQPHVTTVDRKWLEEYVVRLSECDVYDKSIFLTGLVITNVLGGDVTEDGRDYLKKMNNEWVDFICGVNPISLSKCLPPGPYFHSNSSLKPVYRLYDDEQRAFVAALRPRPNPSHIFAPLAFRGQRYDRLSIAVPPRAPSKVGARRPSLRIVAQDCYSIKGLRNSLCSSAYYDHSQPAPFTASVVQRLVDDGAEVLGLSKPGCMNGPQEDPTDVSDFLPAFNPRGDGYQAPAGSSSASAVAVASYDFVDAAVGTMDAASGSCGGRQTPSALGCGLWQFRPSQDEVYLSGMVETYGARLDTPCVLARDLATLRRIAAVWVCRSMPPPPRPLSPYKRYEIICPVDYCLPGMPNFAQQAIIDGFVTDMQIALSAPMVKLDIRDKWRTTHPAGAPDHVDHFLGNDLAARAFDYGFYHASDRFRAGHTEAYAGRPPHVTASVQRRWARGATVAGSEHKEVTRRMAVYRQWWLDHVFRPQEQGREALVILPIANVEPHYRDDMGFAPTSASSGQYYQSSAVDQLFLAPILSAPDVMVPVGEVPYLSRISKRTEFLPVVVNVLGAPGSDMALLGAVEKVMRSSGRPMAVTTGSRMFSVK